MKLPNFIIIGAPKSGTTSLAEYLKFHPQVFMSSLKESYFFNKQDAYKDPVRLASYSKLFEEAPEQAIAIGEACAQYIYNPLTPGRIHALIPDVKLIAILRDPADRAFSEYLMAYRSGRLTSIPDEKNIEASFIESLKDPELNTSKRYFASLQPYFETFDAGQIKIFLFEDLKQRPEELLKEVFGFLGIDKNVSIDFSRKTYNKGGLPKNRALFRGLEILRGRVREPLVKMLPQSLYAKLRLGYSYVKEANLKSDSLKLSPAGREKVIEQHREDIYQLQNLIGRDLSSWLQS
ncbi:MAG: sulfotransferase [Synechococcales bacterium]|nr:sulfotransferase [Synechococcales bacterium]